MNHDFFSISLPIIDIALPTIATAKKQLCERERATTIAITIVGSVINLERALRKKTKD